MEKDIKKVDIKNLEIRSSKAPVAAKNSEREVLTARRSMKRKPKSISRSNSATRMETRGLRKSRMETDDDPF